MTPYEDEPLDPELADLIEAERRRPEVSAEFLERLWTRLSVDIAGLGSQGGQSGPGPGPTSG